MRSLAALALLPLLACTGDAPVTIALSGSAMGTQFNVTVVDDGFDRARLQEKIVGTLEDIEQMMSTYRSNSEITRFNGQRSTDWVPVSPAFCSSVENAQAISDLTAGAFDITVAPLVNLWGFGPDGIVTEPPSKALVEEQLALVGYAHLQTDCSVPALRKDIADLQLDMSAFGKGLAVDWVADALDESGIVNYMVEIGGEIRLRGHNAKRQDWAIGIEAPVPQQRKPHTVIHLTDSAMATSGDYRNYFEAAGQRFSHTIDTRTGKPVTHTLASVTVVDAMGRRADALATALLVMGPDAGMQLAIDQGLAVLFLIRTDGGIVEQMSPAFGALRVSG
jgi:thiamine biosynthesis lipoprotein